MFDGLFGWLRTRVHAAVIGGVRDAIAELETAKIEDAAPEPLRLTFQPPATPEAEAEPARRKKIPGA